MNKNDFAQALIKTENGMIKGIVGKSVKVFKGIPYAKAPVGNLRWKPPVPVGKWSGVRSALHFGSEPIQDIDYDQSTDMYGIASGASYSEDCLYLNIYTPAKDANEKLPVFFWIHGGGFNSGASSQSLYPGEDLAERGNMIVVTINYRLGIFGFLSCDELDEEQEGCSGNYGIMDQTLALQWVKRNINVFGGDSENICIAGQSAGAVSTGLQLFHEKASGLFRRAIIQSGPLLGKNFPFLTKQDAQKKTKKFLEFAGKSTLDELRILDAWELFDLELKFRSIEGPYVFWPCIDGKVLKKHPIELIESGQYNKVDLICGATSEEFSDEKMLISTEQFKKLIQMYWPKDAEKLLNRYLHSDNMSAGNSFIHLLNDSFVCEVIEMAKEVFRTSSRNVYCYYFSHPIQHEYASFYGAPHSAELPYLFGRKNYGGILPWHKCFWKAEDYEFSERLIQMWSSFVHGNAPSMDWEGNNPGFVMNLGEKIGPLDQSVWERLKLQNIVMSCISCDKLKLSENLSSILRNVV